MVLILLEVVEPVEDSVVTFLRALKRRIAVELKNSSQDNLINHSASNLSYLMVDALT